MCRKRKEVLSMGTYLHPGKVLFRRATQLEIYVDKTPMIRFLNRVVHTEQGYVCVSRPRRFGKSMAANMLCAYYDREADGREVFETRKLADVTDWDQYLGKFDVIRLLMTDFFKRNRSLEEGLSAIKERVILELEEAYPETRYVAGDFEGSLDRFYRRSGIPFVFVIDEWDVVFRVWKDDKEAQSIYLDFLRDLLKDKPYVALAYMTGILPIKKYGDNLALNMVSIKSVREWTAGHASGSHVSRACRPFA